MEEKAIIQQKQESLFPGKICNSRFQAGNGNAVRKLLTFETACCGTHGD
jgi:hypothetical protein